MIVLYIIGSIYALLILLLVNGIDNVKEIDSETKSDAIEFSILIPFRNEEKNLPQLINSLVQVNYPREKFECIFIDDASTDDSVKIISKSLENSPVNYRIINNVRHSNSPKKDAIQTAIQVAKNEWIVTTDADCIVPEKWLSSFSNKIYNHHSKLIVGPVTYRNKGSFFEDFQALDFMSLQGTTLGAFGIQKPFLCNGANLAYKKTIFNKLNGFDGNDTIASGDDIFLFEKFYTTYPKEVHFLKSKEAIVETLPVTSWKELVHQRMRWGAKSSSYSLLFGKFVGLIVFFSNLIFALTIILSVINFSSYKFLLYFLLSTKVFVDFLLLEKTTSFYKNQRILKSYIMSSILYPFFTIYIVARLSFGKYQWKDRVFKK